MNQPSEQLLLGTIKVPSRGDYLEIEMRILHTPEGNTPFLKLCNRGSEDSVTLLLSDALSLADSILEAATTLAKMETTTN